MGYETFAEREYTNEFTYTLNGIVYEFKIALSCIGRTVTMNDEYDNGLVAYSFRHYICTDNEKSYLIVNGEKEFWYDHGIEATNYPQLLYKQFDVLYDGKGKK